MAQIWRHHLAIALGVTAFAMLAFAPSWAQDRGPSAGTDLLDRPVLAVDPGTHSASITSLAVDNAGRFAITGGSDRTIRVWSIADGKLLRTIWIPVGPEIVGVINSVAISPDGSTIAVGGRMETMNGNHPIYLFKRESGNLIQRVGGDLPDITSVLTFSPDGRFLAAGMEAGKGLRVFERDKDWREVFRDDRYGDQIYGAAFARDGRLATTADDGLIRLYQYDPNNERPSFRSAGEPVRAPSGTMPRRVAFSPDGKRLAVGYWEAVVDILDGTTLDRVGGHQPMNARGSFYGFYYVAWSRDGQTLFAIGAVTDIQGRFLLFAWDHGGIGDERRMTYCGASGASDIAALPHGRILVAARACLGLSDARGEAGWRVTSHVLDLYQDDDNLRVSQDGKIVDFSYYGSAQHALRFDVMSLMLSSRPPSDDMTLAPRHEGLNIQGWHRENHPTLNGRVLPLGLELARCLAIAPDAKRFFLGSHLMLRAFDDAGTLIWSHRGRGEVLMVNVSKDGRIVIAAYSDGTIRWHRAVDGRELLALQVFANKGDPANWNWVLWTPEGFYEATPGAENVLKWVVNHGPDKPATTVPVSAIAKLHRPGALPLVLNELETARALGLEDITQARSDIQAKTGSVKPPGGVLHVLAIGVNKFGDKAGGLHLDYAVADAHDVASALLESQKGPKASLYADVSLTYLPNDKADSAAILDALGGMAQSMAKGEPGQDVAVILVSSHGVMIDGQFYLIPYGFDAGSQGRSIKSAVSASEFAKKVQALAKNGKVLLLLDACHSGAVGAQGWAIDPDAKVLQDAMDLENVTVLTSSRKNELSEELSGWNHGALAQAFLDALTGAADSRGIVKLSALIDAMDNEIHSLTNGRQHLGMHVNFSGELFVAKHY